MKLEKYSLNAVTPIQGLIEPIKEGNETIGVILHVNGLKLHLKGSIYGNRLDIFEEVHDPLLTLQDGSNVTTRLVEHKPSTEEKAIPDPELGTDNDLDMPF